MTNVNDIIVPLEAAELLGISRRHVQRLCESGAIIARRTYGVWLIDKASVEAYKGEKK